MSAIAGIYHLNEEPIAIEHGLELMKALEIYPADDVQIWCNDRVFLGCHAQWITPESVGEQLPYYDREKQLAITADAIIDNRDELFERLQVKHEHRKGMSDSHLILLAYEKWGEECPKYLVGDFAFMIFDERKRLLFGARDFSGSRTLYFYHDQQYFVFCTVIRPFFRLPYVSKELNEQWLAEFLAISGMEESAELFSTVYKNIEQLPPSYSISVTNEKVKFSRYCILDDVQPLHLKSNQEYEEAFREIFQRAVTSQSRAYRKVGARLSGGLDSGTVASFAARALLKENKRLYTFSYIPEDDFVDWTPKSRVADERPFIHSTVQYVGNIEDYYLNLKGKSPLTEVNEWLDTLEMPYKFFENSFWLKGISEKAQQEGVGVLLNGGRGNFTISWGSALDFYAGLIKQLKWIRFSQEFHQYCTNKGLKKTRVLKAVGKRVFPVIHHLLAKDQYEFPMLINPAFAKRTNVFQKLHEQGIELTGPSIVNAKEERRKHFRQITSWNINGTSRAKLSLRYSLWDRDPTNDLRVIRFCLSVPEEQFVQKGLDRALIRRASKGFLPDKVRLNQRIRGIQGADTVHRMIPSWKTFIEEIQKLLSDSIISQYLNISVIESALAKLREEPHPECAYDAEYKVLMRSLIVYRFMKKFA